MGGAGRRPLQRRELRLTLAELYNGTTKVVTHAGRSLSIAVRPGWKAGTKVTFEEHGVCFEVVETPSAGFTRAGNDLCCVRTCALADLLLRGSTHTVLCPDGRERTVAFAPRVLSSRLRGGGVSVRRVSRPRLIWAPLPIHTRRATRRV